MILSTGLKTDYKPLEAINEADGVYIGIVAKYFESLQLIDC